MNIKAIIFDFDGVIAQTEHIHRQAWILLAADLGKALPEGFLDRGIGSTNDKLAAELELYWQQEIHLDKIIALKCHHFIEEVRKSPEVLVDGVLDAFEFFSKKQLPIGIATSSPLGEIDGILEQFNIKPYLTSLLTLDDVTHPKPAPEVYLRSATALGVITDECLVFEDSILGTTAARAASCQVIGITTSFTEADLQPVLASMPDFTTLDATLKSLAIVF